MNSLIALNFLLNMKGVVGGLNNEKGYKKLNSKWTFVMFLKKGVDFMKILYIIDFIIKKINIKITCIQPKKST